MLWSQIMTLCRMFPAYTPETAAAAPVWVVRDLAILRLSGFFEASDG